MRLDLKGLTRLDLNGRGSKPRRQSKFNQPRLWPKGSVVHPQQRLFIDLETWPVALASERLTPLIQPLKCKTAEDTHFRTWWSICVNAGMKGAITVTWLAAVAMNSV